MFYYIRTDAKYLRTACVWLSKIRNIITIYALAHDNDVNSLCYVNDFNFSRKINVRFALNYLDAIISDIFSKDELKNMDLIISQSSMQKAILKKKMNIESIVIGNSVNLSYVKNKKENIILWVATID